MWKTRTPAARITRNCHKCPPQRFPQLPPCPTRLLLQIHTPSNNSRLATLPAPPKHRIFFSHFRYAATFLFYMCVCLKANVPAQKRATP